MTNRIEWFGPHLSGRESQWLQRCLESGFINDGPLSRQFEAGVSNVTGVPYAVAVTSGTAAITLALMALGIGPGDEVLVPDFTYVATANAVRLTGASVKLVDIEPRYFGIDVAAAERAIGPQTKAIVAVDVNGRGAYWPALIGLAERCGLKLISDSAEAFGSCFGARPLGSYGDAGCFSFSANKTIACGQGGAVVTHSVETALRLRELKDQGRVNGGNGGDDAHPVMGYNFKFTDLQAAVALAQFDDLQTRLDQADARDAAYRLRLGDLVPPWSTGGQRLQWTDVLLGSRETRQRVSDSLTKENIGHRFFWRPIHAQPPYESAEAFPVASAVSARGMWLPSRYDLSDADIGRVCDVVLGAL